MSTGVFRENTHYLDFRSAICFVLFVCSIFHYANLLRKKLLLIISVEEKLRIWVTLLNTDILARSFITPVHRKCHYYLFYFPLLTQSHILATCEYFRNITYLNGHNFLQYNAAYFISVVPRVKSARWRIWSVIARISYLSPRLYTTASCCSRSYRRAW